MIDQSVTTDMSSPSQPLDLRQLSETAAIQPKDLELALWMLSTPQPPPEVILPSSLGVRRRLARAGLMSLPIGEVSE